MNQHYEIRLKGTLAQRWSRWFGGMNITIGIDGNTLLTGAVVDQAALHGVLDKVRDLGLVLLEVKMISQDKMSTAAGPCSSLHLQEEFLNRRSARHILDENRNAAGEATCRAPADASRGSEPC